MHDPLHFFDTGHVSDARALPASRAAETTDHPTPESIAFEIGVILAVTLAIACVVPLALALCGIE
jgi:hypothetical protein